MNAKQLHKHSLPIIVLSAGLCIVSVVVVSRLLVVATESGSTLTQLLTERTLTIKPSSNGWFQASRYQPEAQADSGLTLGNQPSANNGLDVISATGQNSTLDASLAH